MTSALVPRWSDPELRSAIENHYDGLVDLYEKVWGEHIHHGYWAEDSPADRHAAQVRLIEKLIEFGEVPTGARILDAGCGVGASSVHLAANHGATVEGITLAAEQVRRGGEKKTEAGVADRVNFQIMDALRTDFPDDSFDVVWALESCELMPDKERFLSECHRVLKPGGTLVVATWCARDNDLDDSEHRLLGRIYRDFVISHVLPLPDYHAMAERLGFEDVRSDDWSERVTDTWKMSSDLVKPVIKDPTVVWKLVRAKGVDIFRFLNSVPLMRQAYDRGVMHYGVFTGTKAGGHQ
ncbi:gamma-tocopherol methyltransferase [Actinokineospora spheciospongiae]|uniref:Gamma-tocopherol methyltransferase n=1 Tax=Actinokineospora spheciospongiae TaxID=909613 RepID=W7JF29_9PSEU|nr:methyltransferase domain-containing protein [Actinokineospora spheciospongiae]EWC64609.1 gamma-tocopherol methyltransferase [Actinokineospora spheciospongiae]